MTTFTITQNLQNWTGEERTVTVRDGAFEMYGYEFTIGAFEGFEDIDGGVRSLEMDGELAKRLFVETDSVEEAAALAIVWIANHV